MKIFTRMKFTALVALAAAGLTACNTYEEGPSMSFRTAQERVSNNWKPSLWLQDQRDVTAGFPGWTVEFQFDGNFTISMQDTVLDTTLTQKGLWGLQEDKTRIAMYYTDPPVWPDRSHWSILKLKEKELWLREDTDSLVTELRLVPVGE